mmetsp:Transcript_51813/g.77471  ORF Transcript_51813/g.77471 Transcript_51813/m.77471 type:complete len:685 (+) Transcript_51813:15-2069(+)
MDKCMIHTMLLYLKVLSGCYNNRLNSIMRQAFSSLQVIISLLIFGYMVELGLAEFVATHNINGSLPLRGLNEDQSEIVTIPISALKLQLDHPILPKLPGYVVEEIKSVMENMIDASLHEHYFVWGKESKKDPAARYETTSLSVSHTKYTARKLRLSRRTYDSKLPASPYFGAAKDQHQLNRKTTSGQRKIKVFDHQFISHSSPLHKDENITYPHTIIVLEGNVSFSFIQNKKQPNNIFWYHQNIAFPKTEHLDSIIHIWLNIKDPVQNNLLQHIRHSLDMQRGLIKGTQIQSVRLLEQDAFSTPRITGPTTTLVSSPTVVLTENLPKVNIFTNMKSKNSIASSAGSTTTQVSLPTAEPTQNLPVMNTIAGGEDPFSLPLGAGPTATPEAFLTNAPTENLLKENYIIDRKHDFFVLPSAGPTATPVPFPSAVPTESLPEVNVITTTRLKFSGVYVDGDNRGGSYEGFPLSAAIIFLTCSCVCFFLSVFTVIRRRNARMMLRSIRNNEETVTDGETYSDGGKISIHDAEFVASYAESHIDLAEPRRGAPSTWSDQWDSHVRVMLSHSSADQSVGQYGDEEEQMGAALSRSNSASIGGPLTSSSSLSFYSSSHNDDDIIEMDDEEITIEFFKDEDISNNEGSISYSSDGSLISSLFNTDCDPLSKLEFDDENALHYSSSGDHSDEDM